MKKTMIFCWLIFGICMSQAQAAKACDADNLNFSDQGVNAIRKVAISSVDDIANYVRPYVHPGDLPKIKLKTAIIENIKYGQISVGCTDKGLVLGFYFALKHVWVILEIDGKSNILWAILGGGLPASNTHDGSWVQFMQSGGTMYEAVRAASFVQTKYFSNIFSKNKPKSLDTVDNFSTFTAGRRLNAFVVDTVDLTKDRGDQFRKDLETEIGTPIELWQARYRVSTDKGEWMAFFLSESAPGSMLVGKWQLNDTGDQVEYVSHVTIPSIQYNSEGN